MDLIKVFEDKIVVNKKCWFLPKATLESGQCFRVNETQDGAYQLWSGDNYAVIKPNKNCYEIITKTPQYFYDYFNFGVDYDALTQKISSLGESGDVIENAKGLRIIHSDVFETIVSFVISANNNIKRIKLIISRICEKAGEKTEFGYTFPSLSKFCSLTEEFFNSVGAGYRAKYLFKLTKELPEFLNRDLSSLSTSELRKELIKLSGVGPKVADCILLFAFNRYDSFPVDVWIERAYHKFVAENDLPRKKISEELTNRYGALSGYVQQFWFYYMITAKNSKN